MVFGVFACRKDAPLEKISQIHQDLLSNYRQFNLDDARKNEVINNAAIGTGIEVNRMEKYFEYEVRNTLDEASTEGLRIFLNDVCQMSEEPIWVNL